MVNSIIKNHFDLLNTLYYNQPNLSDYKKYLINEYNFIDKKNFIYLYQKKSNKLKGQIILFPVKDKASFGFIDFEDKDAFDYLWNSLLNYCLKNKITKIFGPINKTTWHHYRVISLNSKERLQAFEPWSLDFYFEKLKEKKPSKIYNYFSAYRSNFKNIISETEPFLDNLNKNNFSLKKISKVSRQDLRNIYNITINSFKNINNFIPISFFEFTNIYKFLNNTNFEIFFIEYSNKPIAFAYCHLDKDRYFIKTLAVEPSWQKKGLAKALIASCHLSAKNLNFNRIYYALIREDSPLNKMTLDNLNIYRQYSLFLFNL